MALVHFWDRLKEEKKFVMVTTLEKEAFSELIHMFRGLKKFFNLTHKNDAHGFIIYDCCVLWVARVEKENCHDETRQIDYGATTLENCFIRVILIFSFSCCQWKIMSTVDASTFFFPFIADEFYSFHFKLTLNFLSFLYYCFNY